MKKRIAALLLAICLVLSAAPVTAGAADGQRIAASRVTVTAGVNATVTVTAAGLRDIATFELSLYYDPAVLTLVGSACGSLISGQQVSLNTAVPGEVKLSVLSLDGISGDGEVLRVTFATASDCPAGTYPVTLAVGDVYDPAFSPVSVAGESGAVTVTERAQDTQRFAVNGWADRSALQKGDVLTYHAENSGRNAFASGEFVFSYDYERFSFDSVQLDPSLTGEGAVYSVNSSALGQVRVLFAGTTPASARALFTVTLKVIADEDASAVLKVRAKNIYREDFSAYLPGECSTTVILKKMPEAVDYPDAFLRTERLVVGRQSRSFFCLESGAGVAAADFVLTYDPAVLRCVSVSAADGIGDKGGMVVVNDAFSAGTIRFSYIDLSGQAADGQPIVCIVWEPICSPQEHTQIGVGGTDVVAADQTPIRLDCVPDSGHIFVAEVKEPTCVTEGTIDYRCACGETDPTEILPTIPPEECTHYSVVFVDWDGTELLRKTYHYGEKVEAPAAPERAADETYTYVFKGWDKEVVDCAGDATYRAVYTSAYVPYTVVFVDWDGTELSRKTYHYGEKVEVPAAPTRAADGTYTYVFKGWDKEVVDCAGDATYRAEYSTAFVPYTVVFVDWDGTELSRGTYHYGEKVEVPAAPERAADERYTYTFTGWDKEVTECTGNVTCRAVYTSAYVPYTVVFVDWDGTELSRKTYHYGDKVEAPAAPTRAADETYTYAFKGWDKEVVDCTGDATYRAEYRAERAGYTVSGKAKAFGRNDIAVTVRLMQNGTEIAAAKTVDGAYTFSGVLPGTYRIEFSCSGYAAETRTVEVKGSLAVPDAVLHLLGDLNKDGRVTDADAIWLLMYTFFPKQYPLG